MKDADRVRAEYEAKLNNQQFLLRRLEEISGLHVVLEAPGIRTITFYGDSSDTDVVEATIGPPETPAKRSHSKGSN